MKKIFIAIIAIANATQVNGQYLKESLSMTFDQGLIEEFVSSGQKEFFVSDPGSNVVFITDRSLEIRSQSGIAIHKERLLPKQNKLLQTSTFDLGHSFTSEVVNRFKFDEGAGFTAFPNDQVVVLLDWNSSENRIAGFDMKSGKKLWEVNQYKFSATGFEMLASAVLQASVNHAKVRMRLKDADYSYGTINKGLTFETGSKESPVMVPSYSTASASAFVTPVEAKSRFLMMVGNEQVCIDVKTGKELWRYNAMPITIGFNQMLDENRLLLVNSRGNIFKGKTGSRTSVVLNVETGEEISRFDVLSSFRSDKIRVIDNHLVLGVEGLEIFDLTTGKRVAYTLMKDGKDPDKDATSFMKFTAEDESEGEFNDDQYIGSVFTDHYAYTTYIKDITGAVIRPAARNYTTKIFLEKYDMTTGARVWRHEKIASWVNSVPYADDEVILLRRKPSLGKEGLLTVNASNGEIISEIKLPKGNFLQGASMIFSNKSIFRSDKDGISIYDVKSLKTKKTINPASLDLGEVFRFISTQSGAMLMCKKGIIFIDSDGELLIKHPFNEIRGAMWNDDFIAMFSSDEIFICSMRSGENLGIIPESPVQNGKEMYWLGNGTGLVVQDNEQAIRVYKL
ncbi:MAG: hypothetical protein ACOCWM_00515 [Cyclobacteriaceae bacterium]